MWITLSIDEDALRIGRRLAQRERTSLGKTVSELVRLGAQFGIAQPNRLPTGRKGRFALLPVRDEVITVEHVRALMGCGGV